MWKSKKKGRSLFWLELTVILIVTTSPAGQASQQITNDTSHTYHLAGSHQKLLCSQCHTDTSAPTNTNCIDCHKIDIPLKTACQQCHNQGKSSTVKDNKDHQTYHFGRHCSSCHSSDSWLNLRPSAAAGKQCVACHQEDKPANHYRLTECYLCHNGSSWQQKSFDHQGFTSCSQCHTRPPRHKSGDCESCHETSDWHEVSWSKKLGF